MNGPLRGVRLLGLGTGRVLDAAQDLLEQLGGEVIRVTNVAGPVHVARVAGIAPLGALDAAGALDHPPFPVVRVADVDPAVAWAQSGAMWLTGDPDGPPCVAPGALADRVRGAGAVVQLLAACTGVALDLDPLALLGERAAITGFGRSGTTAVGGGCHLIHAGDGYVALNLARPDDIASLPALLECNVGVDDWPAVTAAIAARSVAVLEERANLLGLALGVWPGPDGRFARSPFHLSGRAARPLRAGEPRDTRAAPRQQLPLVVDLSSLWAGPLATSLLVRCGARVIKVEGARRPDGARRGPAAFFDLLNEGKECVALDFGARDDIALLRALIARADIVVEASRPRVFDALGIEPAAVVRDGTTAWISITGYGRTGAGANRVAFGDDAAVAGGCTVGDPPRFVADAVADPLAGLYAAAAGLAAIVGRRGDVVDLALVNAAAYAVGARDATAVPQDADVAAALPRAREAHGHAAALGAHTDAIRAEFM